LSAYHIAANRLRTTRILAIKPESPTVKTFTIKDGQCAKAQPGQFLMLWIPGLDEIPLSIFDVDENGLVSVAVKNVGEATQALHRAKEGDVLGVRGPFGNSFAIVKGRVLIVAGGTGTAPLLFLAKKLMPKMTKGFFVLGAKTKSELLFMNQFQQVLSRNQNQLVTSTEDGTCGAAGLCTESLEQILAKEKFSIIYTCGPERMIRKVFELAEEHRTYLEASLERLMRCAIGLCGSCTIGKYRVCTDGPVFNSKQLREVQTEFGNSKRDLTGRRIPLD
jgi:dihydroorotate dehydrogenase electron transfer subunit